MISIHYSIGDGSFNAGRRSGDSLPAYPGRSSSSIESISVSSEVGLYPFSSCTVTFTLKFIFYQSSIEIVSTPASVQSFSDSQSEASITLTSEPASLDSSSELELDLDLGKVIADAVPAAVESDHRGVRLPNVDTGHESRC